MVGGRRYVAVDDQPALAARFDLAQAEAACPSFARLVSGLARLLGAEAYPARPGAAIALPP